MTSSPPRSRRRHLRDSGRSDEARPDRTDDPALRRLRALCETLPAVTETGSWGHPNFRAGPRTFATFEWIDGRPSIALRLEAVDVDLLVRRPRFFATPYGRGQWVSVWADGRVNWTLVERLLRRSYGLVTRRARV